MTFRKLLIHWLKLSVVLVLLIGIHVALHIEGAEPLAWATVPGISPTQSDAEQQLQRMLANQKALTYSDLSSQDTASCSRLHDSEPGYYDRAQYYCFEQALQELKSQPLTITDAYKSLQNIYRYEVVDPRVINIRNYVLPWVFGILYALIALSALLALWHWFTSSGLPTLNRGIEKLPLLGQITPSRISQTTHDWKNDRAYRKAAEDFTHLDTLHKNGLISDEVFNLQKSELSARLKLHNKPVSER